MRVKYFYSCIYLTCFLVPSVATHALDRELGPYPFNRKSVMQTNCFVRGARDPESRQRQNFGVTLLTSDLSLRVSSQAGSGQRGWTSSLLRWRWNRGAVRKPGRKKRNHGASRRTRGAATHEIVSHVTSYYGGYYYKR